MEKTDAVMKAILFFQTLDHPISRSIIFVMELGVTEQPTENVFNLLTVQLDPKQHIKELLRWGRIRMHSATTTAVECEGEGANVERIYLSAYGFWISLVYAKN